MAQSRSTASPDTARESSEDAREARDRPRQREAANNLAQTSLRSVSQFWDMQIAATRVILHAQCRAVAAMGLPDYSHFFSIADDRSLRMLSSSTDGAMRFADRMARTRAEIESHMVRLLERQAIHFYERCQYGLDEMQQQAAETLQQLNELSHQQADEMARATESFADATRASMREGGEQFRATVRQRMASMRDVVGQGTEALNEAGERMQEATRDTARETRNEMNETTEPEMQRESRRA